MSEAQELQKRHDFTWTDGACEAFFEKLSTSGSVLAACRKVGVARSSAYKMRDEDEAFAARWSEAIKISVAILEHTAWHRAVKGWREPVYQGGALVGYKWKHSNAVLMRLLEANAPEKYRRDMGAAPQLTVNIVNMVNDANEQARARIAAARGEAQIIDGTKTKV